MDIREGTVASAEHRLDTYELNVAEQLEIAVRLVSRILIRLGPSEDAVLAVAEGQLDVARVGLERARDLVVDVATDESLPPG